MPASARRRRISCSPATPTWCRRATERDGAHAPFAGEIADGVLYRPRRGRHEGRHRLLRSRPCSTISRRNGGKPNGSISFLITGDEEGVAVNGTIKLLEMGGGARRKIRSLHSGRADQPEHARRHDQDRPARLAQRHADRDRHAGPRRLSGACRQSGARHGRADRRAPWRSRSMPAARISIRPTWNSPRSMSATRPSMSFPARRARASISASTISTPATSLKCADRAARGGCRR